MVLVAVPDEILHDIFTYLHPLDLSVLSYTCRRFHSYIHNNHLLWKEIFLIHFDSPREKQLAQIQAEEYWANEVQRRIQLQKLLQSSNVAAKHDAINFAGSTIVSLLSQAAPQHCFSSNFQFLKEYFCDPATYEQNANVFLFSSSLYEDAGSMENIPAETEDGRQLSAQMHSLFGVSREATGRTRSQSSHCYARSRVYDLRRYNAALNKWGPFKHDGRCDVDWEKIEAIMIVLCHNMQQLSIRSNGLVSMVWDQPFEGAVADSYVPREKRNIFEEFLEMRGPAEPRLEPQPDPPLDAMDPYAVTGTWRRVVCFLDYSDFYAFNFANRHGNPDEPDDGPREPIDTQEAIRLIAMKVKVTKIEAPGEDDGQDLPVIHFSGTSRSMQSSWDPNANSLLEGCYPKYSIDDVIGPLIRRMIGTVRLTQEGQVRWTTLSIFHG